jgi:hypothetical protein
MSYWTSPWMMIFTFHVVDGRANGLVHIICTHNAIYIISLWYYIGNIVTNLLLRSFKRWQVKQATSPVFPGCRIGRACGPDRANLEFFAKGPFYLLKINLCFRIVRIDGSRDPGSQQVHFALKFCLAQTTHGTDNRPCGP